MLIDSSFAVIPTIGVGGPLAILALLFPSVFGGSLLLFRQWIGFITVFGVTSLIAILYAWLELDQTGHWWYSIPTVWLTVTFVTVLGLFWAWRRHQIMTEREYDPAPARTELIVLYALSIGGVAVLLSWRIWSINVPLIQWMLTLSTCAGVWFATAYRTLAVIIANWSGRRRPFLSTEGVMLWASLLPAVFFLSRMAQPIGVTSETDVAAEGIPAAKFVVKKQLEVPWPKGLPGMVLSSPVVDDTRLYFSAAFHSLGTGAVYCVNRRTGAVLWKFDEGGFVKQIYSSPRLVNGKIYVGEGFHRDHKCKIYCIDAKTGKWVWDEETDGQTEATPFVLDGVVYHGASSDGVYARDAATGEKIWHFNQKDPPIRIGAGPVVHNGRAYFGGGVDRDQPGVCETALFCLDASNGKLIWKKKTNLPCWAEPVIARENVIFSLGNGDIFYNDNAPKGAVVCLDLQNGAEQWRFDTTNGVHGSVSFDARRVYFGDRDGNLYAIGRFDGKKKWKRELGGAIVAKTMLDQGTPSGRAVTVFAVVSKSDFHLGGRVVCVDAATGAIHWADDSLTQQDLYLVSTPALLSTPTARGTRRRWYFGATDAEMTRPMIWYFEDLLPVRPAKREETESESNP